jgi:hypothetical protein
MKKFRWRRENPFGDGAGMLDAMSPHHLDAGNGAASTAHFRRVMLR